MENFSISSYLQYCSCRPGQYCHKEVYDKVVQPLPPMSPSHYQLDQARQPVLCIGLEYLVGGTWRGRKGKEGYG